MAIPNPARDAGDSLNSDAGQVVLRLLGLRVRGFHGVLESERETGQDFVIDIELCLPEPDSDRLEQTLDYAAVAHQVAAIVGGEPANLIETLAARIADHCAGYPGVERAQVTVHKPQAPIGLDFGDVTATVNRRKK